MLKLDCWRCFRWHEMGCWPPYCKPREADCKNSRLHCTRSIFASWWADCFALCQQLPRSPILHVGPSSLGRKQEDVTALENFKGIWGWSLLYVGNARKSTSSLAAQARRLQPSVSQVHTKGQTQASHTTCTMDRSHTLLLDHLFSNARNTEKMVLLFASNIVSIGKT